MAVNVPMQNGPDGSFPLPFPGEVFLLTRDKTQVSFRDVVRHAKNLKGRLFLTNLRYALSLPVTLSPHPCPPLRAQLQSNLSDLPQTLLACSLACLLACSRLRRARPRRMIFLIDPNFRQKANAETFEAPFRGLWDEKFNQPIFGCNHLTATVQYYDEQPFQGGLTMRIDFVEGGVNTFMPVFLNVMRATRAQLEAERRHDNHVPPMPLPSAAPVPQADQYLPQSNMAFVDPSDPSRIYTTQPVDELQQRRTDTPSWAVSSGLRRRR